MKKRRYILTLFIIIIIMVFSYFIHKQRNTSVNEIDTNKVEKNDFEEVHNENKVDKNQKNEIEENDISKIEEMKQEIGSKADTSIYKIEEELGGRKILQIKSSVQFSVDLAGILKGSKPEETEIDELIKKMPVKSGIWISENSRDRFLKLLNDNKINNFKISTDGYLINSGNNENNIAKKIEDMIKSNKLYIINIKGTSYQRDYISGEIVEYPFEEMDPNQIIEPYQNEDSIILEITSNSSKRISDEEILDSIVSFLDK